MSDTKAIDLVEKTALIVIIKITIKGFYVCHIKNKKNKRLHKSKLKTIKDMTKMQEDFLKTIEENKDLIEENKYLKQSVELLKVQLQRTELPATDKKIIGIVDKMKNKR